MIRNKKSVAVDLKHEKGKEIIHKLAEVSDVILENFIPGKSTELGIDYEALRKINPKLIYCSLSGFGLTGPYASKPGFDVICSAMYGMMHITGPEGRATETQPVKPGVAMTDVTLGLIAHGAILASLFDRMNPINNPDGVGQHIDTSLMEAQLSSLVNVAGNYLTGGVDQQHRWGTGHPTIVPYQTFQCKDHRHIALGIGSDKQFVSFCDAFYMKKFSGLDSDSSGCVNTLKGDSRFLTNSDRVKNRTVLVSLLQERFLTRSRDDWEKHFESFESMKNKEKEQTGTSFVMFPYGSVRSVEESFNCPQAKARNMVVQKEDLGGNPLKLVGHPVKYSRTPCDEVRLNPPKLGEHTDEVLGLGLGDVDGSSCGSSVGVSILKVPYTKEELNCMRRDKIIQ